MTTDKVSTEAVVTVVYGYRLVEQYPPEGGLPGRGDLPAEVIAVFTSKEDFGSWLRTLHLSGPVDEKAPDDRETTIYQVFPGNEPEIAQFNSLVAESLTANIASPTLGAGSTIWRFAGMPPMLPQNLRQEQLPDGSTLTHISIGAGRQLSLAPDVL